jgi:hypothetical protein
MAIRLSSPTREQSPVHQREILVCAAPLCSGHNAHPLRDSCISGGSQATSVQRRRQHLGSLARRSGR